MGPFYAAESGEVVLSVKARGSSVSRCPVHRASPNMALSTPWMLDEMPD